MLLLRPLLYPQTVGLGLGISMATAFHITQQRPIRLDSSPSLAFPTDSHGRCASTPVLRNGQLNPSAVRQVSSGSIAGLCAGLVASTFSRSLSLLLGLLVVGIQLAQSYGIHIIPYNRLQKYISGVELRSAVLDNVAFKLSFGATFALVAFLQF